MAASLRNDRCHLCGESNVIFVTVGTQLPFDRLIRGVDLWAAEHPDIPVFGQTGTIAGDGYTPKHMEHSSTLPPSRYDELCREADLIIAHAGTGSFIKALTFGTPILAVPRKGALNEHRNDHQIATADQFSGRTGITIVDEEDMIAPTINTLLENPVVPDPLPPYAEDTLINAMRAIVFPEGIS